jgi:quinol monooxygenase YgiN
MIMVNVALFVRLEVKPGKESEVENLLREGILMVQEEPATTAWFGIRLGQSTFGIFDAFPNESGRQEHLSGKLAATLMEKSSELLSQPPTIEKADIIAAKLPQIRKEEYDE